MNCLTFGGISGCAIFCENAEQRDFRDIILYEKKLFLFFRFECPEAIYAVHTEVKYDAVHLLGWGLFKDFHKES